MIGMTGTSPAMTEEERYEFCPCYRGGCAETSGFQTVTL